jgi:two-component system, cell cycle response regulator DivK
MESSTSRRTMHNRSRSTDGKSLSAPDAVFDSQAASVPAPDAAISRGPSLDRSPTVLVADDNDDTRQMFETMLVSKGYRVLAASDGVQAIDLIQHESPGLVLLDLGLPRLNGLNVIRRLRMDLGLIEVPLVVITGYDNHFDTAVAAGCDDYLLKPIDFARLDAILDYYVPTRINAMSA